MQSDFADIETIEMRAAKVGVTMGKLCAEARVAHSTYCRWKVGATQPTLRSLRKILTALEARESSGVAA